MSSTKHLDPSATAQPLDQAQVRNLDVAALSGTDQAARQALIKQIRQASLDPGFFYLHNSCVADRLIQSTLDQMKRFFDSPDSGETKCAVHNQLTGGRKGWGPIFTEPSYQKNTVAHLETFDIGQQLSSDQSQALGIQANIWPELPGFREVILEYYQGVTQLGLMLSEVFSEILGMQRDYLGAHSGANAPRTMRLLHYPVNDAGEDGCNVGISAHTDFECFTIIHQTATGLELTDHQGNWYLAPSDIGTFTIILGDLLERLSNGHLKATGHRVANTPWTRYSMALFFALDGNYRVSPLPGFVNESKPSRYAPVTQDAHIARELERARRHETK